jgi:hypothetical protein
MKSEGRQRDDERQRHQQPANGRATIGRGRRSPSVRRPRSAGRPFHRRCVHSSGSYRASSRLERKRAPARVRRHGMSRDFSRELAGESMSVRYNISDERPSEPVSHPRYHTVRRGGASPAAAFVRSAPADCLARSQSDFKRRDPSRSARRGLGTDRARTPRTTAEVRRRVAVPRYVGLPRGSGARDSTGAVGRLVPRADWR